MPIFKRLISSRALLVLAAIAALLLSPTLTVNARPPDQQPIPHALADHTDCLSCHTNGTGGAVKVPTDHAGRTNDQCQACHKLATTASPAPAAAPATGGISLDQWSAKQCQACHPKQWADWSRSGHSITTAAHLLNAGHNTDEQLTQDCLKCHDQQFGLEKIENIVQPMDTTGPWHLVGQYASLGDTPAISCLACHQTHTPQAAGLLPGMDFGDEASFIRGVPAPENTNLYVFNPLTQKHVDPAPIAPVMNGDQVIPVTDTRANRLCYTCHATESAESNVWEPTKAPEGSNQVGTGDDRTLMGAHQGMQCVTCHMPGGNHTFNPMNSCSQCHAQGTLPASLDYVTHAGTSYDDPNQSMLSGNMSALNIHFLDKSQIWPPVVVGMTASDTGDTITYQITIRNNASWNMSNITVHATIPAGSGYLDSWALNQNNKGKFLGVDMEVNIGSIKAGETFGPVVYRVLKGTAKDFTAHAWVVWEQPMTGSANSPDVTIAK